MAERAKNENRLQPLPRLELTQLYAALVLSTYESGTHEVIIQAPKTQVSKVPKTLGWAQ